MTTINAFLFSILVAFSVGRARALPQGTTTVAETATVVPLAGSPYPASPTTNEFKYANYKETSSTDKAARTKVHDAFLDWAPVLQQAMASLDNADDKTFDRWFQDQVLRENKTNLDGRAYVKGVFSQLYQADDTTPTPQDVVASLTCFNNDFSKACGNETRAYTLGTSFHVCPLGLAQTTKASDVDCSDLGDAVSGKMQTLTGTLIHELMHQKAAGDNAPNSVGQ